MSFHQQLTGWKWQRLVERGFQQYLLEFLVHLGYCEQFCKFFSLQITLRHRFMRATDSSSQKQNPSNYIFYGVNKTHCGRRSPSLLSNHESPPSSGGCPNSSLPQLHQIGNGGGGGGSISIINIGGNKINAEEW